MITAYTHTYNSIERRIIVKCFVSAPKTPKGEDGEELKALWDTGASVTCISTKLSERLGLPVIDSMDITVADNRKVKADVHCVQLRMGSFIVPHVTAAVLNMDNCEHDVIIGMDFMINGDTSISHYGGKTVLTFRQPSLETKDYVEELNLWNKCLKHHNINIEKGLPDKCACGSGKDFKNCHGKSVYSGGK